jgi:predicted porin
MRMSRRLAVAVIGCACAAWTAEAQTAQRFSIQGSGLYAPLQGSAYENLKAGNGFEAQLRYTPGAFSYGAGFQYTKHDPSDKLGLVANTSIMGGFFEPRYVFDVGSNVLAPYVSARLAYLRFKSTIPDQPTAPAQEATASGTQINGGGGVLFRLSPRINFDAGVTYGSIRLNDLTVTDKSSGRTTKDPSQSGQNFVFRLGLAIGLGS